jgi:hypothetical protein
VIGEKGPKFVFMLLISILRGRLSLPLSRPSSSTDLMTDSRLSTRFGDPGLPYDARVGFDNESEPVNDFVGVRPCGSAEDPPSWYILGPAVRRAASRQKIVFFYFG